MSDYLKKHQKYLSSINKQKYRCEVIIEILFKKISRITSHFFKNFFLKILVKSLNRTSKHMYSDSLELVLYSTKLKLFIDSFIKIYWFVLL